MTGYQLTKAFYAEVEQNQAMQVGCKAHHHSLYTWICELRNRTGHEVLDLPVHHTMKMAFIGSPHTLGKAIEELAQWGLIEILLKTQGRNTKIKLAIAFLQKHTQQQPSDKAAFAEMQLQKCKSGHEGEESDQSQLHICKSDIEDEGVIAEMQLQKCNSDQKTGELDPSLLQICNNEGENEGAFADMQLQKCKSGAENESFSSDRNCINAKRVQITKTSKTNRERNISLGGNSKNEEGPVEESAGNVSLEAELLVEEAQTPPQPPRAPAEQLPGDGSPVVSPVRPKTGGKGKPRQAKPKPEAPPAKHYYRENVALSEKEHTTLLQKHGPDFTERCLDKLSSYKLAHGRKYESDYGAINQWVVLAVNKDDSQTSSLSVTTVNKPKPSTTAPRPTHQTKIR